MVQVKLKNIVRYGAVAALMALTMAVMVSCQKQEPAAESEPTDTQLMQEAAGDAKAPFYVLVVGNDSRVGTTQISLEDYADGTGRSDTMMLVRVDPVTYKITLVTVPRDTEADYEGSVVKINELYRQGGMEAAVEGVESLTGVHVQYYLDMGFVDFENFVNALGGVTANVPIDMHLKDIVNGGTIELNAGAQELDGPEALVLARVRKLYAADIFLAMPKRIGRRTSWRLWWRTSPRTPTGSLSSRVPVLTLATLWRSMTASGWFLATRERGGRLSKWSNPAAIRRRS